MKIAVVYNRDSKNVINLFGIPNREKYGKKSIKRIVDALKKHGHQVKAFEGDKDLIHKLEEFMPRVLKSERPGMVFNLSYGIQGQARYTHVPAILEMVGIPYVGSSPLAHSLALDKVIAKMIFQQHGLPTPNFAVLQDSNFDAPNLKYPLIVKPRNEAVSMGIRIVNDERELREAADVIFREFHQEVLVEQFIEGREVNVGLLGNNPPETLPLCELIFNGGPSIYTIEDKKGESGREIKYGCPAKIEDELTQKAREIALKAYSAIGCFDCARLDMRLDSEGNFHILEINSLPSLGEHGSYTIAAAHTGLDFPELVNRLVEVACARYFGTPTPPPISLKERDPQKLIFSFLTQRRDQIEKRIKEWTMLSSRTTDLVGKNTAVEKLDKFFTALKFKKAEKYSNPKFACTWETQAGMEGGTLFIGHLDVPLQRDAPTQMFRRTPEYLYGEGIGVSRGPLVMLEYALRALQHQKILRKLPLGVLYYLDEGRDCRYSMDIIKEAASQAKRVFILRPGYPNDKIITQRRGQRKYSLTIEGKPQRLGQQTKIPEVLIWFSEKLREISKLSSRQEKIAVSAVDVTTNAFPLMLPHKITATILLNYLDHQLVDSTEGKIRQILAEKGIYCELEIISERPPMKERKGNTTLAKSLMKVAENFEIPLEKSSTLWPSVAGLVPAKIPVVCGIGPVAENLYTPQESIRRISLVQRTLLLAQFLAKDGAGN